MFLETVQFLIKTIADLFVLVLLLRFYLQVARAPFKHPLCQFVMAATNFAAAAAQAGAIHSWLRQRHAATSRIL
jgi:YggT family protein